jgi:hypothetical protein
MKDGKGKGKTPYALSLPLSSPYLGWLAINVCL